jgi:cell division protein FtsZ
MTLWLRSRVHREDATVIVGTVIDEEMADALRVTVVATGLGGRQPHAKQAVDGRQNRHGHRRVEVVDYDQLEAPAVMRDVHANRRSKQ